MSSKFTFYNKLEGSRPSSSSIYPNIIFLIYPHLNQIMKVRIKALWSPCSAVRMTAAHHKSSLFTSSSNPSNTIIYQFLHFLKSYKKSQSQKYARKSEQNPRNFYGGTHRNFQVKRISKLHFISTLLNNHC